MAFNKLLKSIASLLSVVFLNCCGTTMMAVPDKGHDVEFNDGFWLTTGLWYSDDSVTRKSKFAITSRADRRLHKGMTIEAIKITDKSTGVVKLEDSPVGDYIPFDREVHKIGSNKDGQEVAARTIEINSFLSKPVNGNTTTVELEILIHYIDGSAKRVQMKRVWNERPPKKN